MTRMVIFMAASLAVGTGGGAAEVTIRAEQAALRTEGGPAPGGGWNLWSNGSVGQPVRVAQGGDYEIVVRAWGSPAAGVWPMMGVAVDGRTLQTVAVNQRDVREYAFKLNLPAGPHEIAARFLNDAVINREDRNLYIRQITIRAPAGAAAPVLLPVRALAEAAEAREREIVAQTRSAIEKHRKADAAIRVEDAAGRPLGGVRVSADQTSHDFLFGCNIYRFDRYETEKQNAAYKKRFEALFNYATVGFYWRWYEPERGKPQYEYTDKVVAWCRNRGIRLKGHPLLWGNRSGVPLWSSGQPSTEIQRRRVTEIMQRYKGKIEFWEVVNEPSHLAEPKIDEPYRWARRADPQAYLIVNDYYVLADGHPPFFRLLSNARRNGVPFDGIGIQAHEPRTMRFPLDRVQEVLDHYASLGAELHITEFTPASSGKPITGSHRQGVWDEAAQADYAVKFYRVAFAHPAVRAVTWWDLCDDGSWLPGGGMLREDMSPKPVYEQLHRLIHGEWTTKESGVTDASGRFRFRGFLGGYRLVIDSPDGRVEKTIRLRKGGVQAWTIRLADGGR